MHFNSTQLQTPTRAQQFAPLRYASAKNILIKSCAASWLNLFTDLSELIKLRGNDESGPASGRILTFSPGETLEAVFEFADRCGEAVRRLIDRRA